MTSTQHRTACAQLGDCTGSRSRGPRPWMDRLGAPRRLRAPGRRCGPCLPNPRHRRGLRRRTSQAAAQTPGFEPRLAISLQQRASRYVLEEWRQFSRVWRSRARAGGRCEFGSRFGASAHPVEAGAQPVSRSPGVPGGSLCYAGDSGTLRPARDLGELKMSGGNAPPARPSLHSANPKTRGNKSGRWRVASRAVGTRADGAC